MSITFPIESLKEERQHWRNGSGIPGNISRDLKISRICKRHGFI